jgi:hypothetical protein
MHVGAILRVARPTDYETAMAEMYAKGLDFGSAIQVILAGNRIFATH